MRNEEVDAGRRGSVRQVSDHDYRASLLWLGRYVKILRGDARTPHANMCTEDVHASIWNCTSIYAINMRG